MDASLWGHSLDRTGKPGAKVAPNPNLFVGFSVGKPRQKPFVERGFFLFFTWSLQKSKGQARNPFKRDFADPLTWISLDSASEEECPNRWVPFFAIGRKEMW